MDSRERIGDIEPEPVIGESDHEGHGKPNDRAKHKRAVCAPGSFEIGPAKKLHRTFTIPKVMRKETRAVLEVRPKGFSDSK